VTILIAAVMIAAVAGIIVLPFLRDGGRDDIATSAVDERHAREKHVALLAIREADFDLAMGKLSAEDHASLRHIYEQRALDAMSMLESPEATKPRATSGSADNPPSAGMPAAFCVACGSRYEAADRFCASCGTARRTTAAAG